MGIKERILAEKGLICIGMDPEDVEIVDYANEKLDDAAELAAEADELMAEMADALGLLFNAANHHCSDSGEWFTDRDENFDVLARAEVALEKYNQYKEAQND